METQSPEQLLAAAEEAQRIADENEQIEKERSLNASLLNREQIIDTLKSKYKEQEQVENLHNKANAKVKEVTDRGGKIVPALQEAQNRINQHRAGVTAVIESSTNQLKEIEENPEVVSRLYDEAKQEDEKLNRKNAQELKNKEIEQRQVENKAKEKLELAEMKNSLIEVENQAFELARQLENYIREDDGWLLVKSRNEETGYTKDYKKVSQKKEELLKKMDLLSEKLKQIENTFFKKGKSAVLEERTKLQEADEELDAQLNFLNERRGSSLAVLRDIQVKLREKIEEWDSLMKTYSRKLVGNNFTLLDKIQREVMGNFNKDGRQIYLNNEALRFSPHFLAEVDRNLKKFKEDNHVYELAEKFPFMNTDSHGHSINMEKFIRYFDI